jgi:hypothetical protein
MSIISMSMPSSGAGWGRIVMFMSMGGCGIVIRIFRMFIIGMGIRGLDGRVR